DVDQVISLGERHNAAMHAPWRANEFPEVAEWLSAYEKQLTLVVEASARPQHFHPLVAAPDKSGKRMFSLAGPCAWYHQPLRGSYAALVARAMLKTTDGQVDSAWRDLIACLRLARHFGSSASAIDW